MADREFKASDVTRALKAAKKAGYIARVEIDLERKIMTITPVAQSSDKASESNLAPDDELERWRKKKNAG